MCSEYSNDRIFVQKSYLKRYTCPLTAEFKGGLPASNREQGLQLSLIVIMRKYKEEKL